MPEGGELVRQIAVYGNGGVGKSTIIQNLALAMAQTGKKVMLVGCDPKADSTRLLLGGKMQMTVLDVLRKYGAEAVDLDVVRYTGSGGVKCVESGGPEPGFCAARGTVTTINLLEELGAYSDNLDFIFYDVLGDIMCGGFAAPIQEGNVKEVYIVVSGELMSLRAANNICGGILRLISNCGAMLGGIICNSRKLDNELAVTETFARRIGSRMIQFVPHDNIVQLAQLNKKTVLEYKADCRQADIYRQLAENIINNEEYIIPEPVEPDELARILREFDVLDKE